MQSKKKAAYVQLLEYVKLVLCPTWEPSEMMMDFEKSLRLAVAQVYPETQILGCYFHYTQVGVNVSIIFLFTLRRHYISPTSCLCSIWLNTLVFLQALQKKWSQHGLLKLPARLKSEAKDLKNTLMALPFAKATDIPLVFEEIDDNISLALRSSERIQSFLDYFKKNLVVTDTT